MRMEEGGEIDPLLPTGSGADRIVPCNGMLLSGGPEAFAHSFVVRLSAIGSGAAAARVREASVDGVGT